MNAVVLAGTFFNSFYLLVESGIGSENILRLEMSRNRGGLSMKRLEKDLETITQLYSCM